MDKLNVLYVDDEPLNLMLFAACLKDKFTVSTADNPKLGLEMMKENPDIKIVFSDMRMPIMDGIEFITEAKKISSSIPYYILTGYDVNEVIQSALDESLIRKCFKKPFDLKEISTEIEQAVKEMEG